MNSLFRLVAIAAFFSAPALAEEAVEENFGPVQAGAEVTAATQDEDFASAMSLEELDQNRGAKKVILTEQSAHMDNNTMVGDFTTGDINLSNSYNGINGLGIGVFNTGNQVNMNISTNYIVEFHQ